MQVFEGHLHRDTIWCRNFMGFYSASFCRQGEDVVMSAFVNWKRFWFSSASVLVTLLRRHSSGWLMHIWDAVSTQLLSAFTRRSSSTSVPFLWENKECVFLALVVLHDSPEVICPSFRFFKCKKLSTLALSYWLFSCCPRDFGHSSYSASLFLPLGKITNNC